MTTLDELSVPAPDPGPADWNDVGVVDLPGLLPKDLIGAYQEEWMAANGYRGMSEPEGQWSAAPAATPAGLWVLDAAEPGGWEDCTPYMRYPALRALCTYGPLAEALEGLLREPAGVHLNLTGWVSTQRNWHQDGYLNPEYVGDSYAAVWMALGDVHPDSGVFQFIPGSHRWHRLTRQLIGNHVDLDDPAWPAHTEAILTDLVEKEIGDRGAEVMDYAPNAGDVLIWHPRLYHRGSAPMVPNAYRPALIAHFSGIHHRPDMPAPVQSGARLADGGGWLFPIRESGPVR